MTQQSHSGGRRPGRGRRPARAHAAAPAKSRAHVRPLEPTATPPEIDSFRHWDLGEPIQLAIEAMGIKSPTPIQRLAIGPVLAGKDVIAKAETGTGKTLAFGAPMIAKIDPQRASVLGLVLCPTRELAEQVQKVLAILGAPRGIQVALIVGGEPAEPQVRALKAGAQVVVGTPGRILDLYKQRFLSFPWTEFAILDEADVMFEIGFIDDVKQILSLTPDERQTLLFSATFPPELLELARANTRDPAEVATASGLKTVDTIEQSWIRVTEEDRALTLMRLIENSAPDDVFLVFCARRTEVDKLMRRLERLPYGIKALHGGYDQAARFRVMTAFRTGEVKALVATDVASRGLDVAHVTHVVNYTSPLDVTDYTHRIGRTGRAGRSGRAITLVGDLDHRRWSVLQRAATWDIAEIESPRRGPRPLAPRADRPRDERGPERGPERERGPDRTERGPPRAGHERERPVDAPAFREERPPRRQQGAAALHREAPGPRPAGGQPAPARVWPRDEHAPRGGAAPARPERQIEPRQIEPRPDDPLDRRDRPLRNRPEAPGWPVDDDSPRADSTRESGRPRHDSGAPEADRPRRAAGRARSDAERGPSPHAGDTGARPGTPGRHAPQRERDAGRGSAQARPPASGSSHPPRSKPAARSEPAAPLAGDERHPIERRHRGPRASEHVEPQRGPDPARRAAPRSSSRSEPERGPGDDAPRGVPPPEGIRRRAPRDERRPPRVD